MTLRGSRRRDSMFRSVYAAGSDHQLLTSLQHFTWIHISYRSFVPGGYFLLPTLTTSPQLLDFSGGGGLWRQRLQIRETLQRHLQKRSGTAAACRPVSPPTSTPPATSTPSMDQCDHHTISPTGEKVIMNISHRFNIFSFKSKVEMTMSTHYLTPVLVIQRGYKGRWAKDEIKKFKKSKESIKEGLSWIRDLCIPRDKLSVGVMKEKWSERNSICKKNKKSSFIDSKLPVSRTTM